MVPSIRISRKNEAPTRADGRFVLYWMISARRTKWNFALDRALEWSEELELPVLVFEPLRCDYPWASDRLHRYVLDGMADNGGALEGTGIGYYPYVEPEVGAGSGLLEALADRAAVVVTDEFPTFFLPRMVEAASSRLDVRLEAVDSNGLLPLAATERERHRAFDFRRDLQKDLADHLADFPSAEPPTPARSFDRVPSSILESWPAATADLLEGNEDLSQLPIDHSVRPIEERGGSVAGASAVDAFVEERLARYGEERGQPESGAASELSGYLHFGHVSAHQVLDAVARQQEWTPLKIAEITSGKRSGWWGMDSSAESFLDELVTWRELGYHFAHHRADHAEFDSLPEWARESLAAHERDERPELYTLGEFEQAETHDEIWNAAQNELRARGRIHNYLRMLWGKKILHWTRSPREALDVMIELNNKYAIDGRNPNSYSGIFWVLGRFDRAWGPERPVFGKIRYMSSKNTRRKLKLGPYLERWADGQRAL